MYEYTCGSDIVPKIQLLHKVCSIYSGLLLFPDVLAIQFDKFLFLDLQRNPIHLVPMLPCCCSLSISAKHIFAWLVFIHSWVLLTILFKFNVHDSCKLCRALYPHITPRPKPHFCIWMYFCLCVFTRLCNGLSCILLSTHSACLLASSSTQYLTWQHNESLRL